MILNTLMSMDSDWIDQEVFSKPLKSAEYLEDKSVIDEILKEVELIDPKAGKFECLSQRLEEAFTGALVSAIEASYKNGFQTGVKHLVSCLSGEINSI